MKRAVFLVVFVLGISACSWQQAPTADEPVGAFRGNYADGAVEEFELRRDGSFLQELTVAGRIAYKNEGRWRVDGHAVVFDGFYCALEFGSGRVSVPTVGTDNVRGQWITLDEKRSIVFDIDRHYAIEGARLDKK